MNWDAARAGFEDELFKIADVNLRGLSAETVMKASQPPPAMETPGFQKARDILGRASMMKTSASRHVTGSGSALGLPQIQRMKDADQKDPSLAGRATSLAGHTGAGAGVGRMVGFMAHGPHLTEANKKSLHSKQWYGTAIGAGVGAASYLGRKAYQGHQAKKKAELTKLSTSPAQSLKATQQVGGMRTTTGSSGPGPTSQIRGRLIGKKFVPPGV